MALSRCVKKGTACNLTLQRGGARMQASLVREPARDQSPVRTHPQTATRPFLASTHALNAPIHPRSGLQSATCSHTQTGSARWRTDCAMPGYAVLFRHAGPRSWTVSVSRTGSLFKPQRASSVKFLCAFGAAPFCAYVCTDGHRPCAQGSAAPYGNQRPAPTHPGWGPPQPGGYQGQGSAAPYGNQWPHPRHRSMSPMVSP